MNAEALEPRLIPWLEPPQMETGAPLPAVHSNTHRLHCAYLVSSTVAPRATALLRFESVLQFRFGYPNDEALAGHPLFGFGLSYYAFYLVEHSPLVAELERQNRVHSRHSPGMYQEYRHWIITFHDETLEVVALRATVKGEIQSSPGRAVCEP